MTRWALILTGYKYSIRYRSSSENANADSLSRLPLKQKAKIDVDENYIFHTYVYSLPVTAQKIAKIVQKDQFSVEYMSTPLAIGLKSVRMNHFNPIGIDGMSCP